MTNVTGGFFVFLYINSLTYRGYGGKEAPMPEMTGILCTVSEVSRRAASVQALIDKICTMSDGSLNNFDAALLSMNLEIAADALKTVQEMAAYLSRPVVETSRL